MTDVESELDCAQLGALIKRHDFGTITVTGRDRLTWLNGLVTCDLAPKRPGDAAYGLAVGKTGKILSELFVLVGAAELAVGVRKEQAAELVAGFDRYLVMEDATITLAEPPAVWLSALGLRAPEALAAVRALGAYAGMIERGGLPVALIQCSAEQEADVVNAVSAACAPSFVASPEGWERVRVEHGIPELGVDFDSENYPQEAALERDGVSFQKGCYLGQEAVFMLEKRGHVKKRLVQLHVEGPVAAADPITLADGTDIGVVTSAITRPGRNLALGYVKYKYARAETDVIVGTSPAKVTVLLAIRNET